MRKLLTLLMILLLTTTAYASDPANPADPDMVVQLLPGYTYVTGIDDTTVLRLLMRNTQDELVFVGGVKGEDGAWRFTESTPLPEGTILGVENFTHSLGIPNGTYYSSVSVKPYADGTWGVSMIEPGSNGLFSLAQHVIYNEVNPMEGCIGIHPWADITAIDWTTLPASNEEAVARIDTEGWAVVSNPDPADRLHLRTAPDRSAESLGKYYNRTPVRIREYGEDWCAVTVCGLEGYMMTKYLAFGEAMDGVAYAGPWLTWKEELTECRLYAQPSTDSAYTVKASDARPTFYVMGVAGDFYHVWLPNTEEYFYVRMDDLWEGNG